MLKSNETEIVGQWVLHNGSMQGDDNCDRIQQLINEYFVLVGHDESGWDSYYQDPRDGRYWVLFYPNSTMHGGGPPTLSLATAMAIQNMRQAQTS